MKWYSRNRISNLFSSFFPLIFNYTLHTPKPLFSAKRYFLCPFVSSEPKEVVCESVCVSICDSVEEEEKTYTLVVFIAAAYCCCYLLDTIHVCQPTSFIECMPAVWTFEEHFIQARYVYIDTISIWFYPNTQITFDILWSSFFSFLRLREW